MPPIEAIAHILPGLISGAIGTVFNVGLIAFIGFIFWLWKRRLTKQDKQEEKEEEVGPVLYKKEHDDECEDWRIKHDGKAQDSHNKIIAAIENVRTEQKVDMGDMRKDNVQGLRRVHERIDGLLEVKR